MQDFERQKLQAAAVAFTTFEKQFAQNTRGEIPGTEFKLFLEHLKTVEEPFPGLLPPFDADYFRGRYPPQFNLYDAGRIGNWLQIALATLNTALETASSDPVTFKAHMLDQDLSFVTHPDLQKILRRDFLEIEKAAANGSWKSVIILSGSAMEALLVETIEKKLRADGVANVSTDNVKLYDLIQKAFALRLVSKKVTEFSHTLRDFRNLIHANVEIKKQLHINEEEARLAVAILALIRRDLAAQPLG